MCDTLNILEFLCLHYDTVDDINRAFEIFQTLFRFEENFFLCNQ